MNANELRIRNLVEYQKGCYGYVYSIESAEPRKNKRFSDKSIITIFDGGLLSVPIDEIDPIPLTEDWLLKMGFVYRGIYYHFPNHDIFKLEQYKNKNAYWLRHASESLDSVRINHVHTLQNLYFSLTGEELQLTN